MIMRTIVDNFDILLPLLTSKKSDTFYTVQIVKRAKDHPGERVGESALAFYYIKDRAQLIRLREELITLSNLYGARVYINVSPKSRKKLQENVAQELLRKYINGEYDNPAHTTKSEAGKLKSKTPMWIVDVDDVTVSDEKYINIKNWIEDRNIIPIIIPTMTGFHFLTPKFDSYAFEQEFPETHIHKNSMGTLLYFEKDMD